MINQYCVADFVVGGSHMSVVDQLVRVFLYLLGVGYKAGDVFAAVAGGEDYVVGVDFGVPEVAEYLGSAPAVHYGVELAVEAAVGSGGGFDYLVAAVAVFRLYYLAFKKGGLEFLVGYLAVGELLAALEVDFFSRAERRLRSKGCIPIRGRGRCNIQPLRGT